MFRRLLSWVWNHIYQGIEVHHAQAVRQACQSGAEIIYMPFNFKKKDGFKRSIEISKEKHIYRQDYCGCEFSMKLR